MPEHLWGQDWMVPENPDKGGGKGPRHGSSGGGDGSAVDKPNWNARQGPR